MLEFELKLSRMIVVEGWLIIMLAGGWLVIELVLLVVEKKESIRSEVVEEVWREEVMLELVVWDDLWRMF